MSAFRIPFVSTRTAMTRSGRSSRISPVASPAGDWRDLPRMAREAIEVHCEGEDLEVPAPSSLEELRDDPDYEGGQWVFVEVDPSALDTRIKNVNLRW